MNSWVRLWHDMPTDPKWRVIARKSGQPIPTVMAVFNFLLVNASANAIERGCTRNIVSEDIAACLDISASDVDLVLEAMQGKVLEGNKLQGWDKRQPKREDEAAERAKKWRERKRTQTNASDGDANAPERPDADTDADAEKTPPTPQGGTGVVPIDGRTRKKKSVVLEAPEVEAVITEVSARIHARHPDPRRDISAKAVGDKLRVIVRDIAQPEKIPKLRLIDSTHAARCLTEMWSKDGGEFAKGLENWLAPTMGRFDSQPVAVIPKHHPLMIPDYSRPQRGV